MKQLLTNQVIDVVNFISVCRSTAEVTAGSHKPCNIHIALSTNVQMQALVYNDVIAIIMGTHTRTPV